MNRLRRHLLGLIVGLPCAPMAAAATRLRFGVVPQMPPAELARAWTPFIEFVGERVGLDLRFATAPDIPTFEARLADGQYDIAYMNPYHYTVFHQRPGYRAFAAEAGRRLRGILVVREDSPLAELGALGGRTLAFPAPASFAATVLPLAELSRRGVPVTPRYVNSHASVYLTVAAGLYPAGGGVQGTFDQAPDDIRAQLRVLWTSAPTSPHAFAAHPRVGSAVVMRVRQAMVAMADDEAGRALLKGIGFKGVAAAEDGAWDDVRALQLGRLAPLLRD